ncbi:DUF3888 domain-containing protein [Tenuibacillus multivorans]|uniref:DUF3888 domain-containing protein n=1 Tax=Tenuibacillus multivorans TaxID=237069 RepID=A0A1H0AKG7_9BACI|nr:DUF3888 domain-containing protein [Tenuibacillus multivorans]GEL78180.1 hypothetical protein TMU01_24150 [Tenuibacillus multivorans]SDN33831.1 Protein of unknown function [Tenuibacillus multivorans]
MKKIGVSLIILFGLFIPGQVTAESLDIEEDMVMGLLEPYVEKAVEKYYGQPRDYDQDELVDIKRIDDCEGCFEAVIEVRTYIESQEPPYGYDTIRLDIRGGDVTIIDFVHDSAS